MTATISIRVFTGTTAGTQSDAVTGIDLIAEDNADNSPENRAANPIPVGENSYEKYIKARVDVAPDNYVENFQAWGPGSTQANTDLMYGLTASAATPVRTGSVVATTNFNEENSASKLVWHAGQLTAVGHTTQFLVFQLQVGETATQGNWTQQTINYSYDEA